jgi:hypothetical protein
MEILETHDFKKPSRSRYAEAVKALIEDGVFAVRLKRGEDFPEEITAGSASGSVRQLIDKQGRIARCFIESERSLVVSLQPEGTTSRTRKPARSKQAA